MSLEQLAPIYGAERRRFRVMKFRGTSYRGGYHDFSIRQGGLFVFPRLVAGEHSESFKHERIKSGVTARPAPIRSMISAVQAAVRARQRQYQIRDHMEALRIANDDRQHLLESERAARQETERVGRIKDQFLATLSHELRTPLNAIFGWAQIMKMSKDDPRTMSEGVEIIDRNVRVQAQLIEDLLDISRIVSGKVHLDVQRVELSQVIDAALESVMPALTAKQIRLEKVVDASVGCMSADPNRLQQVFWNLLSNAIKFTPKGGKIRVLARRAGSQVEISVIDSSEGIAPDFLPRLFDRFSQADPSTTRKHGGLGLGLSIVRNLVEMHGGSIHATSAGIGQGATFTVHLPIRELKSSEHTRPRAVFDRSASRLFPSLVGLKVLVVDDEPDALELVRRFLEECQAITALAASAAEAQALLSTFQPDVIISDIGMPVQDGYAFMRAVRVRGLKIPAVALTGICPPRGSDALDPGGLSDASGQTRRPCGADGSRRQSGRTVRV